MDSQPLSRAEKAEKYALRQGLTLSSSVGGGVNGSVWYTNSHSAVKVFDRLDAYVRERDAYIKLTDLNVTFINEFAVPRLRGFDNELLIVEMDIVQPPFVVDFAGAYLDNPPDFPPEVLAEQEDKNKEHFGSKWPKVRQLLAALRGMGIHYVDINRGNIRFPEFDEETAGDS